jgi:hypothetical protein
MSSAVLGLLLVLASSALLLLLEPITRSAKARRDAWREADAARRKSTGSTGGDAIAIATSTPSRDDPRPAPQQACNTIGNCFSRVVSPRGLIGLLLAPVTLALFLANTMIIAAGLELLFDSLGTVITVVSIGASSWNFTDLHLFGALVTLALVILGAAFFAMREEGSSAAWVLFATGLLPLIALDVALAYLRGRILAADSTVSPEALGIASALQAFGCANAEIWAGYFAITCFLVPSVQLLAAMLAAPFRAVAGFIGRWRAERALKPASPHDPDRPGLLTSLLAYLDEGIISALRGVDDAVLSRLRRRRSRHAPSVLSSDEIEVREWP